MDKESQSATNESRMDDSENQDNMDTLDEESASKQKLNSPTDPSRIKFSSVNTSDSKNGEAKVDIHVAPTSIGMNKEELMKYANEPFWVRLRMALFILFWLTWLAMLVSAVVIILMAPRCPPPPKNEWYQKSTMYQVDVQAFKDSNGDGIGDIRGLTSKLDYFSMCNVKTVLISAIYSMVSGTEGVVNFTDVDNKFGTMTDFKELIEEMHKKDMKLVLDFIPNHSSDEHPWFKKSVKRELPYANYYVWSDQKESNEPPNNWLSVNGGSMWEWNAERRQYYLHTFGKHTPDLNLRNTEVRQEIEDIMRFWLEKGVDGFKIKSASHLIQDSALRDEPLQTFKRVDNPKYGDLSHIYTLDQAENYELFAEWRRILNNYTQQTGSPKIMMAELSGHVNDTIRYYGNSTYTLVDFPLNTELTKLHQDSLALDLKDYLDMWKNSTPDYAWPNWVMGNEHTDRLVDRVGSHFLDSIFMITTLLRGTPIAYFGDEIAMVSPKTSKIMPMLWSNEAGGGFTNRSDFQIPVNLSASITVENAKRSKHSHLKIFGELNKLRNYAAIDFGKEAFPIMTENIFTLMRVLKGSPGFLFVLNMGVNDTVIDFTDAHANLPDTGRVEIRSLNIDSGPLAEGDHPKIKFNKLPLGSKQAVVISFVPRFLG